MRSFLVLPLVAGTQVLGCLGFVASSQARAWPKPVVERCRLIADLFASAMARQRAEDAMRQAELEAQKSRQELAHFLRVSTIGELTTSLAHELNQPLTAILANAETATRLVRDSGGRGLERAARDPGGHRRARTGAPASYQAAARAAAQGGDRRARCSR